MFELRDVRADVVISFYPCVSPLCVSRTCVVIGLGRYAAFQLVPSDGWDDIGCDASSLSNIHARDGEQRSYHPDHQACGRITLDAAFFQGNKYMYKHNALPTHAHNTKDMRCTQLSPPHLHTPRLLPSRRFLSDPSPSCFPTPPFHTTAANSTSGTYGHHPTCFNSTKLQCRSRASCAAPARFNVAHHTVTCRCAE